MPELPEVETTLRGIAPHITGKTVCQTIVRQSKLRWNINHNLADILQGQNLIQCTRRAKYLLLQFPIGVLLIHLGMSGSLRIFSEGETPAPDKHDHVDIIFNDGTCLRYHDPRRFGAILWYTGAAETHPLLQHLAPEPLSPEFNPQYLHQALQNRKSPIKTLLMDNKIVVGVGNIYANESLFLAGISPHRQGKNISQHEATLLVHHIRAVLRAAIQQGGSTLRDFVNSDGKSGYFQQQYTVYGRHNQACVQCGGLILKETLGQRGTFYCPHCQT